MMIRMIKELKVDMRKQVNEIQENMGKQLEKT
jgi:hypothetical protein